MGWMERVGRAARAREAARLEALSTEPVEAIAGCGPSPWLEEKLRGFGARLIAQANGLSEHLHPPRVLGVDAGGQPRVPNLDVGRTILQNQVFMMQALAAMNDHLLVVTTGRGVLEPLKRPEASNGNGESRS